jgi:hypothetical protein
MTFTRKNIIELHKSIVQFGNENFEQIEKLNLDPNDEHDSTYSGMILRQITINNDISTLLKNKNRGYLTSEFILLRCLIDDFIHVTYIVNQENSEEVIIDFNADAISKNYTKIFDLATLNEEKLGGNYPHYPTYALMEEIKEKIKNSPKRQQYFKDKINFKFKSFKTTGNLIRDLGDIYYAHQLRRAYFIWRKLSDYVHYSNSTFETEQMINPETDSTFTEFAEIISYSYMTIVNCFIHFSKRYNLKLIDTNNLQSYYKYTGHK